LFNSWKGKNILLFLYNRKFNQNVTGDGESGPNCFNIRVNKYTVEKRGKIMKQLKRRGLPFVAIIATVLFWGLSYISTKSLLETMTPFQIAACRYGLTVIILFGIGFGMRWLKPLPFRELPRLMLAAFIGIGVYFVCENSGLKLTTAGMGSLIIATIPVINTIVTAFWMKKPTSSMVWVGVLLSVAGVFIILQGGADFSFQSLWGNLLVLGAAFSWVAYTLLNQPLSRAYDVFSLNAYQAVFGAIFLIILAWMEGVDMPRFTPGIAVNLVFLAFCCSALGYFFYNYALRHLGSTVVTTFINFIPVVGVLGGVFILGESLGISQIVGGVIILTGVFLVSMGESRVTA